MRLKNIPSNVGASIINLPNKIKNANPYGEASRNRKQAKANVINKAIKEGEQIFMKNKGNLKLKGANGFRKAIPGSNQPYDVEAFRVQKQVVDTRVKAYEEKLKKFR